MNMHKTELRKCFLEKRKSISVNQKMQYDVAMCENLLKMKLGNPKMLFTYFPLKKYAEPDTLLFTNGMLSTYSDLKICFPKTNLQKHEMQALFVNDETSYEMNDYGLTEPVSESIVAPAEIDIVFIPLLCFDGQGYRVGYGKGYYDKYLSQCRKDVIKIAFSYFDAVVEISDRAEWDIALNYCITPNLLYAF